MLISVPASAPWPGFGPNGMTAYTSIAATPATMGDALKTCTSAPRGVVSSFVIALTPSAIGCSRPHGPARFGADRRSPLLPAVPTIAEAGWPLFDVRTWIGVVAPRGTPAANIDLVHAAVARATAAPTLRAWMDAQGLEPLAGTPASFGATLRADHEKWGRVIRQLGLAPG